VAASEQPRRAGRRVNIRREGLGQNIFILKPGGDGKRIIFNVQHAHIWCLNFDRVRIGRQNDLNRYDWRTGNLADRVNDLPVNIVYPQLNIRNPI